MDRALTIAALGNTAIGPHRRDLLATYQRWITSLDVNRTLRFPGYVMTLEQEAAWLDAVTASPTDVPFLVYRRADLLPIGSAGLTRIDHRNGTAEFGLMIGEPEAWNQGHGTEATRLVVDYGFHVLGLGAIHLEVYAGNPAAQRVYAKAGFRQAGVLRRARRVGQRVEDIVLMDCLPEEADPAGIERRMQAGDRGG